MTEQFIFVVKITLRLLDNTTIKNYWTAVVDTGVCVCVLAFNCVPEAGVLGRVLRKWA